MNDVAALPRAREAEVFAELARGLCVVSLAKSYDRKRVLKDVSLQSTAARWSGCSGPTAPARRPASIRDGPGEARQRPHPARRRGHHRPAHVPPRRLGLGYLPQETSIFRGLTVAQNIMAVLEVAEPDKKVRRERLEQLLGEFHIAHCATPRQWRCRAASGGAARSPGRSPPTRRSCSSTSRSPASIRSPSPTSATS
jgi:lipopolysaccharide export system ATP-binding protein